jgi:hypothetical protein
MDILFKRSLNAFVPAPGKGKWAHEIDKWEKSVQRHRQRQRNLMVQYRLDLRSNPAVVIMEKRRQGMEVEGLVIPGCGDLSFGEISGPFWQDERSGLGFLSDAIALDAEH